MSPTTTSTDSHDSLKHSLCVLHRPTHIHTCGGSALRGGNQEGQRRQRRGEWLQSAGSAVIRRHSFAANHVSCLPCPFIKKPHARCPCCMIFYPHPTSRSTTNATASTSTPPQTLSSFMPSAAEQKDCAICVSWRGGGHKHTAWLKQRGSGASVFKNGPLTTKTYFNHKTSYQRCLQQTMSGILPQHWW